MSTEDYFIIYGINLQSYYSKKTEIDAFINILECLNLEKEDIPSCIEGSKDYLLEMLNDCCPDETTIDIELDEEAYWELNIVCKIPRNIITIKLD